ncbi:hypothetical protein JCM24511_01408 [Saitozyma sp. JCM 24511]|nr:hypothetical protein JCM24511_01408 [Saitozyma sp. JCM 24511]
MSRSPSTPGCFGGFFRRRHSKTSARLATHQHAPARTAEKVEPCVYTHANPCCGEWALPAVTDALPAYTPIRSAFNEKAIDTAREEILAKAPALQEVSLFMFDHPELGYKEYKAHDKITSFLEDEGFEVEKHFLLPTAFKATYTHGKGGRTFGLNSELDALPEIGHACGHPLIAVAGLAALLGLRAAMKKHDIDGTVVLLGTPAEEGGAGKVELLKLGGYKGMDACMMAHPGHGQAGSGGVAPSLAIQTVNVEFFGKTAHAAGAPWDGINALDAANLAYSAISAMRQQLKTTDRVHGIITNGGQAPNIIPEHTQMRYFVRATTVPALEELKKKIIPCFEAAAKATGCGVKIWTEVMTNDLRNCKPLAEEYAATMMSQFNIPVPTLFHDWSAGGGSTDFGNVTYALPSCHPHFGIPFTPGRANHTPEFTDKARQPAAHAEAWKAAVGMASVGIRVLADETFAKEARKWWEGDMEGEFF